MGFTFRTIWAGSFNPAKNEFGRGKHRRLFPGKGPSTFGLLSRPSPGRAEAEGFVDCSSLEIRHLGLIYVAIAYYVLIKKFRGKLFIHSGV
jgi:hypothetical protein